MITRRSLLLTLGAIPIAAGSKAAFLAEPMIEQPRWSRFFSEADAVGSIVVSDERPESTSHMAYDPERAHRRYPPASTFKIPHSLFALHAGLVRDEFQILPWDRVNRPIAAWNTDQTLRSAMRNSVLWVYQEFARAIGRAGEASYMRSVSYGNCLTTGDGDFWVDGDLAISCTEQIQFLRRLYRNELPFRVEHQRLVKDVMIVEAGRNWIVRAKTGWSGKVGRWVGWVEWPSGPVFFALNIDTSRRLDLPKREEITRNVLRSIGALPKN